MDFLSEKIMEQETETKLSLTISFSEWDDDIQKLKTSKLAEEVKLFLADQKEAVETINRYLAKSAKSSAYKKVPNLNNNAIAKIKNFHGEKSKTLAHIDDKSILEIIRDDVCVLPMII